MLSKFSKYMQNYALYTTHRQLMGMSDRQLEDVGISRTLLAEGITKWPWREEDARALSSQPARMNAKQVNSAIRELSGMSDRDLRDIGIDRGSIRHSVVYGVTGRSSKEAA